MERISSAFLPMCIIVIFFGIAKEFVSGGSSKKIVNVALGIIFISTLLTAMSGISLPEYAVSPGAENQQQTKILEIADETELSSIKSEIIRRLTQQLSDRGIVVSEMDLTIHKDEKNYIWISDVKVKSNHTAEEISDAIYQIVNENVKCTVVGGGPENE